MAEKPKAFGERYMVKPGKSFRLADCDPRASNGFSDKEATKADTVRDAAAIDALQDRLFAENKRALLVVLQGIDCSGKDGTVRAVFNHCGPIGVKVQPFKAPTVDELAQDYLWRVHKVCPPKGYIGIFNRSHYEECLVTRVHPDILQKEKLPPSLITKNIWQERFEDITGMERYLARNGTVTLKFFLNLSRDEQRKRFLDRLEQPSKNWKFSMGDVKERALWPRYMAAYQDIIRHTSQPYAPWHVVPADHKWFARVVIGSTIVSALDKLDLHFPKVDKADRSEFKQVRQALLDEDKKRKKPAKGKAGKGK